MTQTAHLAHAGREGFWLGQIPILGLIVALFLLGDKLRQRRHLREPSRSVTS